MARPKKSVTNVTPINKHHQHDTHEYMQIEIDRNTLAAFRPAAIARGSTPERVIKDIINTIASEQPSAQRTLIDAIIDD